MEAGSFQQKEDGNGQGPQRSAGVLARQDGLGRHRNHGRRTEHHPKGSVQILDDEHLIFADLFSLKTRENLEKNPKIAVTVIDEKSAKGYQIKGTAELIASGPLYDQMAEKLKQASAKLPPPKYVVKIAVDSVYDQSVGPNAGKQLV